MNQHNHPLKRLQNSLHSSNHVSSSNDVAIRESTENLSKHTFKPAPFRARRGGARGHDRHWNSLIALPKRTIYYDLAESFMDHSTNPLSSDLYKIRFKHSNKQWPNGRFMNYKEKLDKLDGNITEIKCTKTFPLVPKRKKIDEKAPKEQHTNSATASSIVLVDPIVQEQKKKLADQQTNFYANLFGLGKIPRLTSKTQAKKNPVENQVIKSSAPISLLDETRTS